MARQGWGRHTTVATGSNDATKQVSVNAWNADLDNDGVLGFTPETIASASTVTPTNSLVKLSGSTSIDTIAITNTSEGDLLWVYTSGSVTLNNTSSPSSDGDIKLSGNANKDLSTTVPTTLIRVSTYWYEYAGGDVTSSSTTTFTNKSIDLTDNTLTGTSLELKTAISDETGSGSLVFATSPTFVTPALGTPASGTLTNCTFPTLNQSTTGSSASCTGNSATATALETARTIGGTSFDGTGNIAITTNADLTGDVTSSGNATTIATDAVDIAMLSATGTAGATTFLRGDNTWATAGGGFGDQQFWCDGGAFIPTPSSTAGTATSYGQTRVLSNGVSVSSVVLPEHATIDSRCTFTWTPPENWDAGTILAKIYWTMEDTTTTSVGDTGAFEVSAVAISNDDTLNASFGTAVPLTDVFIATDDLHVATISGAITVGGSPANADLVQIQINRNAGSDTLEAGSNVELLGIILEYTQDASTSSG